MWEQIYNSKIVHPVIPLVFLGIFFIFFLRAGKPARWYFVSFTILTVTDALVTGGWLSSFLPSFLIQILSVFFILIGDAKYYIFISLLAYNARKLSVALAVPNKVSLGLNTVTLTLIAPFTTIAAWYARPEWFSSERNVFLVYEVTFAVINILFRISAIPKKLPDSAGTEYGFLMRLNGYVGLQYALWALSDLLILKGQDAGFGLRMIPNLMFYVFFLPYVFRQMRLSLKMN